MPASLLWRGRGSAAAHRAGWPTRCSSPIRLPLLERVHVHRALDNRLKRIPALPSPADDLLGFAGIIGRGMDVDTVVIVAMRERRIAGANPAGGAMQLLKGDGGERRGQGPTIRQQQVDRRVAQTTDDARLVVVAPTRWPRFVEYGLDLRVLLRRDQVF